MFVEKTPRRGTSVAASAVRAAMMADDLRGGVVDGFIKFVSEMLQGRPQPR